MEAWYLEGQMLPTHIVTDGILRLGKNGYCLYTLYWIFEYSETRMTYTSPPVFFSPQQMLRLIISCGEQTSYFFYSFLTSVISPFHQI